MEFTREQLLNTFDISEVREQQKLIRKKKKNFRTSENPVCSNHL